MANRIVIVTILIALVLFLVLYKLHKPTVSAITKSQARELFEALDLQHDRDSDTSPNEIIPGLFLGGMKDADSETLNRIGITAVLNMAAGLRLPGFEIPGIGGLVRKDIPALDNPFYDLGQHFDQCFEFIDSNLNRAQKTLVHCHAGVSRSCAIVAMYLSRKYGWDTQRALFYIKGVRPRCCPNEGFIEQLLEDHKHRTRNGTL